MAAKYKVTKYEAYPEDEPTSILVGILCTVTRGPKTADRTLYREATVPLAVAKDLTEEGVRDEAYKALKADFKAFRQAAEAAPGVVGQEFDPPGGD